MNPLINDLKVLMDAKSMSQTYVSRSLGISNSALCQWLSESYTGNVAKINNAVKSFMEREKEKNAHLQIDFVMTSVAKKIFEVARVAHIDCEIGVCYGQAGLGKTRAVKEYADVNPDVILIEADLGYTTRVLFSELHKKIGLDGYGIIHSLLEDSIQKLKGSGRLIIIDEAEHLPYKALDLLRRIHDKASIGVLLVGMPRLIFNLKGKKGQYEQLYSRIGIAGKLSPLRPEDTENIVNSLIPESHTLWKSYHETSLGNTRILTKLLTRSKRVSEINNKPLNEQIVQETARMLII